MDDEACELLLEDLVSKLEVVIAVVPVEYNTFTLVTLKGASTLAGAGSGSVKLFSMMGVPCADVEQAEAMAQWFSDRRETLQ